MNLADLQLAQYRGAAWFVTDSSISGGRKDAKKEIVDSDFQVVEDLGKQQRIYSLNGIVAARRSNDGRELVSYERSRDQLLAAFEEGGTAVLIHPFYGRLENMALRNFTIDETDKALGRANVTATFEVSNTAGAPEPAEDVLVIVITRNTAVVEAVGADISENFSVTDAFAGNFQDAIDKGNEIVDEVNAATEPLAVASDKLDAFAAQLSTFSANIASLVDNPSDLSDSIIGIFDSMNGLYAVTGATLQAVTIDTPQRLFDGLDRTGSTAVAGVSATFEATYDAFVRLFTFGDNDTDLTLDTASRIEKQDNRDVLNKAMRVLALSFAYENASQLDFPTADAVDEVSKVLEDEYQALIALGLESTVEEELTKLRISVADFFIQAKLQKPQIVSVFTPLISTRLLAFQYYGASDLGKTIADLNGFADLNGVEGNVDILSA